MQTSQRGDWIVIEVSDTGPEATPNEIESIFSRPNLAVEGAPDPRRSGAISRTLLVEADGGKIQARVEDGWGLNLIVQLPIDPPSR